MTSEPIPATGSADGPLRPSRSIAASIGAAIRRNYRQSERNLVTVAVSGALGMPLFYFVWHDLFPQPYENLPLRMIGALMCLLLVFKDHWPHSIRRYTPALWYATVLYSLPFFFTYMTLRNDFAPVWLVSFITALLLLVFLVDWLSLVVLSFFGTLLAWAVFALAGGEASNPALYYELMPVVLFALVVGTVFSYRSEMLRQERLDAMLTAGRNLANELRPSLFGIKTGTISLSRYLPILLRTYEMAEEESLPIEKIAASHRRALGHSLARIERDTEQAVTIIEMLLRNTGGIPIRPVEFDLHSMAECVEKALARYPFASEKERKMVKVRLSQDFRFVGSDSVMVHVVLSLLKNALASVARNGKGDVEIELDASQQGNRLSIRDRSGGATANRLSRMFDEASSLESDAGRGPALAFAKRAIESFSGKIACRSPRGQYTEFVISLPSPADAAGV